MSFVLFIAKMKSCFYFSFFHHNNEYLIQEVMSLERFRNK